MDPSSDLNVHHSFPPSEPVPRPESASSHKTDSTLLNIAPSVSASQAPLPPPLPPVPPLDMSFLISPPPPVEKRPGSPTLTELSSVITKPPSKLQLKPSGEPSFTSQGTDFELRGSLLQEQRAKLKTTEQPHPNQLTDLSAMNRDMFLSIAEVIKKVCVGLLPEDYL